MNLAPDGLAVSGWVANTGTVNDALLTNDGDTTYAEAGADTETCTLTFAAPSVADGAISSITSVQVLTYGRFPARGSGGTDVEIEFEVGATAGHTETLNIPNNASYQAVNGTARTTNPAGSAWSYANLGDVEVKLTKDGASSPDVRITYLSLLVTYVAAGYGNAVNDVASANIGSIIDVDTADIDNVSDA